MGSVLVRHGIGGRAIDLDEDDVGGIIDLPMLLMSISLTPSNQEASRRRSLARSTSREYRSTLTLTLEAGSSDLRSLVPHGV